MLSQLAGIAEQRQVAIIMVTHLNKNSGANPLYRLMGSLGFGATARAVWMVTKDDLDENNRLFLGAKNNIAETSGSGLSFKIIDMVVRWGAEAINMTAAEYFNAQYGGKPGPEQTTRLKVKDWLNDILKDGPSWVSDIEDAAKHEGFVWRTVQRAKKDLGIKSGKNGLGRWYWRKADQPDDPPKE